MGANDDSAAPRKRRRQQRGIDTRLKIIDAALSEFGRLGFEHASTRRIAQTADVSHSLVLHHFRNKDNLWLETVKETAREYGRRMLLPADRQSRPAERLCRHFAEYVRFSAKRPDFFRMMTQENALNSARLRWLVEQHTAVMVAGITSLIEQAQADGAFVEGDPLTLLYVFLGAATAPYRSAAEIEILSGRRSDDPARVEAHIRTLERMFFRTTPAD